MTELVTRESPVLIAGSGHLGDRLEVLLREAGPVVRVDAVHPGPLVDFEAALGRAGHRNGGRHLHRGRSRCREHPVWARRVQAPGRNCHHDGALERATRSAMSTSAIAARAMLARRAPARG
jgi:hypothetical protein